MRLIVLIVAGLLAGSSAHGSSSTGSSSSAAVSGTRVTPGPDAAGQVHVGCCTDPDVLDFGYRIDFSAWPDGEEITFQLQDAGLLFGKAISSSAPATMVLTDPARAYECQQVLNGDPPYAGWEYFIFVDPTGSRWSTVQKVGANVGYADRIQSCFIAAYDADGHLLDFRYNDRLGFQFLSIQRPTADISRVLVGDCNGPFCYQDGGGSAMNCLTYSGPVSTPRTLPANIPVPAAPIIQGVPGVGNLGLILLSFAMAGLAAAVFIHRGRSAAKLRA